MTLGCNRCRAGHADREAQAGDLIGAQTHGNQDLCSAIQRRAQQVDGKTIQHVGSSTKECGASQPLLLKGLREPGGEVEVRPGELQRLL